MKLFNLNINRPAERTDYWNTFAANIFLLLFSGGILLAAFFFPVSQCPISFCAFLHLTGYPCPTCGFTRAFCAFAHGNWAAGLHDCPFALLLFIFTALIFIYNAFVVLLGIFDLRIQRGPWLQFSSRKIIFIAVLCAFLLAVNWGYRLLLGFK